LGPSRKGEQASYDWIKFRKFWHRFTEKYSLRYFVTEFQYTTAKSFSRLYTISSFCENDKERIELLIEERLSCGTVNCIPTRLRRSLFSSLFSRVLSSLSLSLCVCVPSVSSMGPERAATASSFVCKVQLRLIAIKHLGGDRNGPLEMAI
jgi:hypothetical protein